VNCRRWPDRQDVVGWGGGLKLAAHLAAGCWMAFGRRVRSREGAGG